jgi:hypothetical protein
MAALNRTAASLRIFGDHLNPSELTRLLGCEPTDSKSKGQETVGKSTGQVRIAKTGSWHLDASRRAPGDLDGQIGEILSRLPQDLQVWKELNRRFKVDLFCGLFLESETGGSQISATVLAALGDRGIELNLDIYAGDPE